MSDTDHLITKDQASLLPEKNSADFLSQDISSALLCHDNGGEPELPILTGNEDSTSNANISTASGISVMSVKPADMTSSKNEINLLESSNQNPETRKLIDESLEYKDQMQQTSSSNEIEAPKILMSDQRTGGIVGDDTGDKEYNTINTNDQYYQAIAEVSKNNNERIGDAEEKSFSIDDGAKLVMETLLESKTRNCKENEVEIDYAAYHARIATRYSDIDQLLYPSNAMGMRRRVADITKISGQERNYLYTLSSDGYPMVGLNYNPSLPSTYCGEVPISAGPWAEFETHNIRKSDTSRRDQHVDDKYGSKESNDSDSKYASSKDFEVDSKSEISECPNFEILVDHTTPKLPKIAPPKDKQKLKDMEIKNSRDSNSDCNKNDSSASSKSSDSEMSFSRKQSYDDDRGAKGFRQNK